MIASIQTPLYRLKVNFSEPLDISLPLSTDPDNASAWYVDPIKIEPVRGEGFIGSVAEGGSVNFRDIRFNPHGNGTHTECVGHITPEVYSVNAHLKQFFFVAQLISVAPLTVTDDSEYSKAGDQVITEDQLLRPLRGEHPRAVVIRTLPNQADKKQRKYSNTNPPYIDSRAVTALIRHGVDHLLIDLPSIDRESDGGALRAHHAFWEHPERTCYGRTITEFIYVPDQLPDGIYLLNLMIAPFENDASPSKPVLYKPLEIQRIA